MISHKIHTSICELMRGDYFIPEGENTVYKYIGFDEGWCLWEAVDIIDKKTILFDDMACIWLPLYECID